MLWLILGFPVPSAGTAGGAGKEDDEYSGGSGGNNDVLLACSAVLITTLLSLILHSVALELSLKIILYIHSWYICQLTRIC